MQELANESGGESGGESGEVVETTGICFGERGMDWLYGGRMAGDRLP